MDDQNPIHDYSHYFVHGGRYRPVDFSKAWEPSPISPVVELAGQSRTVRAARFGSSRISRSGEPRSKINHRKPSFVALIIRFLKRLQKSSCSDPDPIVLRDPPRIPDSEWKAWSYYAYPLVNGGFVRNVSPGPSLPIPLDAEEVAAVLLSPGGSHHPENWINGLKHPSLPPRPTRWSKPRETDPQPFPAECALNPFLVHNQFGPSPVTWDIGQNTSFIYFNTDERICLPLSCADKKQPANWPFLTHLYINALSDDPASQFPWPIMIRNSSGIKCEDVFAGIYDSFQEPVAKTEFDSWSTKRKELAHRAFEARRHDQLQSRIPPDVWLRRIDYLGDLVWFKGLEPHPNYEGWVLFLGLP